MGKVLLRETAFVVFGGQGDGAEDAGFSEPLRGVDDDIETIPPSNKSGEEIWGELCALPQDARADVLSGDGVLWALVNNCGNRNGRGSFLQGILADVEEMASSQITAILSAEGAVDALSLISFRSDRIACAQQIVGLIEELDEGQRAKVLSTENVLTTLVSVFEEMEAKDRGKALSAGAGGAAPVPGAMA